MASNVVPCQLTTPKKVNFARLSRLVIDLFARILRDILIFYYPRPEDLQQKIKDTNLEQKFKKDRDRILHGDSYEKCDVSLLYTLIRYACEIPPPTITNRRKMEWGGDCIPSRDCTTLGDEIERIRIMRNRVLGHVPCTEVENNEFEKYFDISLGICQRLTGLFGMKDYVNELETIRTCRMEIDPVVILTEKVNEVIKMNEEMRTYVGKETRKMGRKINKVYQEMNKKRKNNDGRKRKNTKEKKQQQDSECSELDYSFKNIQGNAILPTLSALDLLMQTDSECSELDYSFKNIQGNAILPTVSALDLLMQTDSECSELDYFFKNIQGNAISPTVSALDFLMQTDSECSELDNIQGNAILPTVSALDFLMQTDSECSELDYFFKNIQENAILPTLSALDFLMQTENHNVGISRKKHK